MTNTGMCLGNIPGQDQQDPTGLSEVTEQVATQPVICLDTHYHRLMAHVSVSLLFLLFTSL